MFNNDSNDLKAFADLARSFAIKELAGKVAQHDSYPFGDFYQDILEKAYHLGFLGVTLPATLGGIEGGMAALCEILLHICEVDASPGGIIFTQMLSQKILLAAGAGDLAQSIFPKAASAKEMLVAFPVYTNPAQTDSLPLAQKIGNDYNLTGRLELLVLGSLARQAIIPARHGHGSDYSFFLISLDDQKVEKSEPVFTLGLHACPAVDVMFSGIRAHLIGEENAGLLYFEKVSPEMNFAAAAMNAGILRGAFNEAFSYSQKREQGGRPIIHWSEIGMMLASMSVKADVAAMCVHQSCLELEQKSRGYESRISAAALHLAELACNATTDGIQVLGGYGYMKDYGQEKRYRDARMVQALLGAVPLKKLDIIQKAVGAN